MNAVNEVAVAAFLSERISFTDISDVVYDLTMDLRSQAKKTTSLEEILSYDRIARSLAEERVAKIQAGA